MTLIFSLRPERVTEVAVLVLVPRDDRRHCI
jgi:hypothetical protein